MLKSVTRIKLANGFHCITVTGSMEISRYMKKAISDIWKSSLPGGGFSLQREASIDPMQPPGPSWPCSCGVLLPIFFVRQEQGLLPSRTATGESPWRPAMPGHSGPRLSLFSPGMGNPNSKSRDPAPLRSFYERRVLTSRRSRATPQATILRSGAGLGQWTPTHGSSRHHSPSPH